MIAKPGRTNRTVRQTSTTSVKTADAYKSALTTAGDPTPYLLKHGGLPGPRANLELARLAADVCTGSQARRWAGLDCRAAPTGSAQEFLAMCGVLGLGRLLVEGDDQALADLRHYANDCRWRVREAVAMALQRWGAANFSALFDAMSTWASGSLLERRAASAAVCEPALLTDTERVMKALAVLEQSTSALLSSDPSQRRSEDFKALRKGLGYCWSVAVAADFAAARPAFEALVGQASSTRDRDLLRIARENLRKHRLRRLDPRWTASQLERLQ